MDGPNRSALRRLQHRVILFDGKPFPGDRSSGTPLP